MTQRLHTTLSQFKPIKKLFWGDFVEKSTDQWSDCDLLSSQKKMCELDQLKGDLEVMKEKCDVFLKQASSFPSLPTLSSELLVLVQNMGQVYSMSSIFMDK